MNKYDSIETVVNDDMYVKMDVDGYLRIASHGYVVMAIPDYDDTPWPLDVLEDCVAWVRRYSNT